MTLRTKGRQPRPDADGRSLWSPPVVSWAFYDLANTIFSMNIVSLYLSLWVVNVMGGSDAMWGYANSLSMALVFVTAPLLGALSDQAGRRLPFLFACTLGCVVCTALLGTAGLGGTLVLFVVANFFFQASLIFYDATLPIVSDAANRGRVGGFGIGLGYLGSFTGVLTGLLLLDRIGHVGVFRVTALLFLVFALPIFVFVREPAATTRRRLDLRAPVRALRQVRDTFAHLKEYPRLARFLIGRTFYTDAANTVIIFIGVYTVNEAGFTETGAQLVLLVAIAAAVVGGFAMGVVVDRYGAKRTLDGVLVLWMVALAGGVAVPVLDLPAGAFWIVACLTGIAMGGTWASDRPYMLALSPPDKVGEFYGLYSMVGRFSAIVGPAMWALVAETLGLGRPAALASLGLWVAIAFVILRPLDDGPLSADPSPAQPAR